MINAPYEKEFVFQDGRRAKNLSELSNILSSMNQKDFEIFVNINKNDFANWTEYVLEEKKLADYLRLTTDFSKTKKIISDNLPPNLEKQNFLVKKQEYLPEDSQKKNIFSLGLLKKETSKSLKSDAKVEVNEKESLSQPLKQEIHHETTHEFKHEISHEDKRLFRNEKMGKHKWYHFKKVHEKSEETSEEKHKNEDDNEVNIFWVLLYALLIILIVALIIYKFVLN